MPKMDGQEMKEDENMSEQEISMPTKYDPQAVETGRYEWWLQKDCFKAQPESDKEPYSIVIPPPNVTGKLRLSTVL